MAVTQNSYTGDGSKKSYSFTFPYLKAADVKCSIDATVTTAFTLANATTVQFNTAPANNAKIKIYRETDDAALPATFYTGSAIKSEDLNDNFTQNLYSTQEVTARYLSNLGGTMTGDLHIGEDAVLTFEGATDDAYETTLTVTDPTADRTITLPNETGTVITSAGTNVIDSAHYVAGSIDLEHMSANSVDSDQYVDGSIGLIHMSANSVDSDQYVDGSIDLAHMSANSVDSDQYVDGSIDLVHMSANSVDSDQYVDGSIDGVHIANDAIDSQHYAEGSIDLEHMSANSVDSDQYVDGSIDLVHMSANSVDSDQYVDGSIDLAHMSANSVDSDQYVDGSIDRVHLSPDIIDATKIEDNAVTTDHIADAELTTLAGMQSGTASILASGTALAATNAEINTICDGKGVQTTISDSDAHYPTSGAVVDYVAAQIAPLGGLEVIANEDSFPTQPASGVVISIADAGGIVVNGSGVSTTARTSGNGSDNVTINGFPSTLYSTTLTDNMGLLVSSTGSSNTYTYHKLLGKESDIKTLSDDINDFNARYRIASSAPGSNNDDGDLYFDTSTKKMKVYNGATSAWDDVAQSSSSYIVTLSPAFNSVLTNFTMSTAATDAQSTIVSINGVIQKPNAGTSNPTEGFAIDGNTIKFSNAPATDSDYFVVVLGDTVSIGTPSDNTVATAKIQNLAVTGDKVATNLDVADDKTIRFGTDNDFSVSYNNTDNRLNVVGSSGKKLRVNTPSSVLNLDCETDVTGSNDINFVNTTADPDQNALYLGYQHGGNGSRIGNKHSSGLKIWSDHGKISKESNTGFDYIVWNDGTSVDLYYADSKKLETASDGVKISGGEGEEANLTFFADEGDNASDKYRLRTADSGGFFIENYMNGSSWETNIKSTGNGAVDLYYDNVTKIETMATGIEVNGRIDIRGDTGTSARILFYDGDGGDDYQLRVDDSEFYVRNATDSRTEFLCKNDANASYFQLPNDVQFLQIGAGQDLDLHHNGTNSYIRNATGDLHIRPLATEEGIILKPNGATEIYHDNAKKINTAADGATVTGNLFVSEALQLNDSKKVELGTGGDLQLYHNGTDSFAAHVLGSGAMRVAGDSLKLMSNTDDENYLVATKDGAVELYYDDVKQCETVDGGMNWADGKRAYFGNSSDLQIYHDGSNSYISDNGTGKLRLTTSGTGAEIELTSQGGSEYLAQFIQDGAVKLYYDGGTYTNAKLETTSYGVQITGNVGIGDTSPTSFTGYTNLSIHGSTGGAVTFGDDGTDEWEVYGDGTNLSVYDRSATRYACKIHTGGDIEFDSSTRIGVGCHPDGSVTTVGAQIGPNWGIFNRSTATPLYAHRSTSDGTLIAFYAQDNYEGNITVSGTTVSLTGGHLSRWSQLKGVSTTDKSERPTIYQGTVMSNLDDLCVWNHAEVLYKEGDEIPEGKAVGDVKKAAYTEDNQQLNMTKVSDTVGDKDVAGVFWTWDDDDDEIVNDFYIAMTGDMVIRVAGSTTVARGDLLESAGDGTAKPQSDDIIRSKTIAKIISTNSTATYPDGSKAYPCVLMAC